MVITDARQPDYPIVLANDAFLNLTGYSASEVLGRNCRFLQGDGTSPAAVAEIRSGLKADRDVSVELLNYRKDGTPFWNRLHLTPVHDDAGQLIYHFGSQIDETKYRQVQALEASEHRLLMEVDHRTKNVLALVDSIVRLSRADDPHRYAAAIQHRVQSLARTHGLLSQRNWQSVRLDEILKTQLEVFGQQQVSLSGPVVELPAEAVQPIGLVVHELAVNAAQHGALSSPSGQVHVEWAQVPESRELSIRWVENGGPPAPQPEQNGFGLVMSEGIVRLQLQGNLERQWLPNGLVTEIRVPDPQHV
jgi:PAS domain S-box-containing protein